MTKCFTSDSTNDVHLIWYEHPTVLDIRFKGDYQLSCLQQLLKVNIIDYC